MWNVIKRIKARNERKHHQHMVGELDDHLYNDVSHSLQPEIRVKEPKTKCVIVVEYAVLIRKGCGLRTVFGYLNVC